MKTHVLILSEYFPKTHPKAGLETYFFESILHKVKKHTIRENFDYWEPKIKEVQEGKAVLSLRKWTGKPYNSKQVEVFRLTKEDGVGIEETAKYPSTDLAQNDGLEMADFMDWFKGSDWSQTKAIIHFTPFRYGIESKSI